MSSPVIGLTTSRTRSSTGVPLISAAEAYAKAVIQAGGIPILIPSCLTEVTLDSLLDHLDGILFTGGGDMHPENYGGDSHPLVEGVDPDRDQLEIRLMHAGKEAGLPFFGICRGLQLVNVALGGSLFEDILDQKPGSLRHLYTPDFPRSYQAHTVEIKKGSRLAQITGRQVADVNSLHHQGIRQLAPNLKATALAPDGIIEAVELEGYHFGLAVQWHPEWLTHQEEMMALFRAFVQACQNGTSRTH